MSEYCTCATSFDGSCEIHDQITALKARLAEVRRVCDEQANDEGLWFVAVTVTEDYLQAALRRLHAAVEGTASQPRPLTAAERSALDRAFARSITVLDPGIDATGDQPTAIPCPHPDVAIIDGGLCACCGQRVTDQQASQPSVARCSNCGGSGIIRWQAYDGTEEGHEEQDPCPVCTTDNSSTIPAKPPTDCP